MDAAAEAVRLRLEHLELTSIDTAKLGVAPSNLLPWVIGRYFQRANINASLMAGRVCWNNKHEV
jgi:hypothetical protein